VAVCDSDLEKAARMQGLVLKFQETPLPVFSDYRKMLEVMQFDAVDICTMHESHHIIGCDAMRTGANVLIEKPLGLTIKAAKMLVDCSKETGRLLATAENYRRSPYYRMLTWVASSGFIGNLRIAILLDSSFSNLIVAGTKWRHQRLASLGGHITDRGIHHADIFELAGGKIDSVFATTRLFVPERYNFGQDGKITDSVQCETPDTCVGIYNYGSGAIGMYLITCAGAGQPLSFHNWKFIGSEGTLIDGLCVKNTGEVYNQEKMMEFFYSNLSPEKKEEYFPRGITNEFAIEINDFVQAILTGRKPEVNGEQGLRNMAVNYALVESATLNQPVMISDVENGKVEIFQKEINIHLGLI
jgi:predicted dehydrogenase